MGLCASHAGSLLSTLMVLVNGSNMRRAGLKGSKVRAMGFRCSRVYVKEPQEPTSSVHGLKVSVKAGSPR